MFATRGGTRIFYEVAGEGPAIVFVHGLGGTSNVWHAQRVGLAKYFRVITLDLPGSGRSSRTTEGHSMDGWADDVLAVADAAGLGRLVLVGHSMTTVLAQRFAVRHAARAAGIVLCGPLTELAPPAQEVFRKRAERVMAEGMIAVADGVLAGALTPATREANPALAGLYRELLLANDPACYAAHCRALIADSARADQPEIACPTLILLGDQDGVTPLSLIQPIAAAIRGCRLHIIPATAHLTMLERPELFNAALVEFCSSLPALNW